MAALANDGCALDRPLDLPPEIDALAVERLTPDGWALVRRLPLDAGPTLLPGVEVGDATLRVIACAGDTPRHIAQPDPTPVGENTKSGLILHFKPLDRLACTGTTRGVAYNQYAALGAPRAFASASALPDGRVLVVGGADRVDGDSFTADQTRAGWDLYTRGESLFLPGIDRSQPLDPRPLNGPRVAADAVPYRPNGAEAPGVLVIGGAPAVRRGVFTFGPLAPDGEALSTPAAEFFDPQTGAMAPVEFALGAELSPRFLPGVAADDQGRIAIIGGIEWPGGAPTDRIEIIDADRLSALFLPLDPERQAQVEAQGLDVRLARNILVGPSVVPIGAGRFFIWGGDYNGCGQNPGWLLSLDPTPTIQPLSLVAGEAPPSCGEPLVCRTWYSTAYHSATRLPDAGGLARVLVTGGVAVGSRGLTNNPDPGADCGPNAFVATIDPAAGTARIDPVGYTPDAADPLKRALHAAVPAGDEVLIAGGWAFLGNATAFNATDTVLTYRDGQPVGTVELSGDRLVDPRIGLFAAPLPGGGAVLGGGLQREPGGEFVITASAETYTPPISTASCAPPDPP